MWIGFAPTLGIGRCEAETQTCREPSQILYYTILYYTILHYTVPYYTILYYTILYYTTVLYFPILSYPILYVGGPLPHRGRAWTPRGPTTRPRARVGIHYRGGAVGGGVQWMEVALYNNTAYNIIQITAPCFNCTPPLMNLEREGGEKGGRQRRSATIPCVIEIVSCSKDIM